MLDTVAKIGISAVVALILFFIVTWILMEIELLCDKIRKMKPVEIEEWVLKRVADCTAFIICLGVYAGITVLVYYVLFGGIIKW